ncbi:MAG: hypothetical protein ABIB79_04900 [archaeon]
MASPNLTDIVTIMGSAIVGLAIWIPLEKYLDSRTMRGGFVDPRPSEEQFMNHIGYYKGASCNPRAEIPPATRFGKIAQYFDYYKIRERE